MVEGTAQLVLKTGRYLYSGNCQRVKGQIRYRLEFERKGGYVAHVGIGNAYAKLNANNKWVGYSPNGTAYVGFDTAEEAIKAVETDMLRNGWFNNFQDASKYALEKLNNKLMEKQEQ